MPVATESESTLATTPSPTKSTAPHTIVPIGSDDATTLEVPTSLTFAPTMTSLPPTPTDVDESSSTLAQDGSTTTAATTGFPTSMPRMIQPPGGIPQAPSNGSLIQIGFNYGLNYGFVAGSSTAISQIFAFLPQGIAYGLGIDAEHVKMNALMPYDTSNELGYMTTLAQAYIPSDLVDQLQLDLHTPVSNLYGNPTSSIRTLMSMVNPSLPVQPGASLDGTTSNEKNPAATTSAAAGDGAPIGGDSGSSQPVRGTSVGIGVGACAGAALYAAAMVYVARRYKKKRARHARTPSVPASQPEMSQRGSNLTGGGMGGYFMSGANGHNSGTAGRASAAVTASSGGRSNNSGGTRGSRNSDHSSNGRSVREQGISAPVMSENSLGWN